MTRGYHVFVVLLVVCGCNERRETSVQSPLTVSESRQPKVETAAEEYTVVKLTPAAIAHFREAQKEDGKPFLRVAVVSGGSTGFMYDLKFDDQINDENDYFDDMDGIKVVVDKRSALFLEGATIDWQTTADGRQGFHFDNPNAVE
jgi:iron-sulfur cluster assembly accessory protein